MEADFILIVLKEQVVMELELVFHGILGGPDTTQKVTYVQNGYFPLVYEIAPFMLINEKINEFADGRIIATSDAMYQKYVEASWTWR